MRQEDLLIVRRGKRKQQRLARFFLTASMPQPGAPAEITVTVQPAEITVTVQLASYGWTRLVTAASPAVHESATTLCITSFGGVPAHTAAALVTAHSWGPHEIDAVDPTRVALAIRAPPHQLRQSTALPTPARRSHP
jgi:hypothetical protein